MVKFNKINFCPITTDGQTYFRSCMTNSLPLGKKFVIKAVMYKNVDEFLNSLSKFGKCPQRFTKKFTNIFTMN
jgi:hypothetical protein